LFLWHVFGRQRRGESLNDLNLTELHGLEQEMEAAVKVIRDRKVGSIYPRKVRVLQSFLLSPLYVIDLFDCHSLNFVFFPSHNKYCVFLFLLFQKGKILEIEAIYILNLLTEFYSNREKRIFSKSIYKIDMYLLAFKEVRIFFLIIYENQMFF